MSYMMTAAHHGVPEENKVISYKHTQSAFVQATVVAWIGVFCRGKLQNSFPRGLRSML